MTEHFRGTGHILRFIEYMDVSASNGWRIEATFLPQNISNEHIVGVFFMAAVFGIYNLIPENFMKTVNIFSL